MGSEFCEILKGLEQHKMPKKDLSTAAWFSSTVVAFHYSDPLGQVGYGQKYNHSINLHDLKK